MKTTTVLRASSSADFLAALPRLTDISAPDSCFVVALNGTRTAGVMRIDLPTPEQISSPGLELAAWIELLGELLKSASSTVVVIDTAERLTTTPASSVYGRLAQLSATLATQQDVSLRDLIIRGSDGWASFTSNANPTLESLFRVTSSELYSSDDPGVDLDEWRREHPGCTSEDLQMVKSFASKVRDVQ